MNFNLHYVVFESLWCWVVTNGEALSDFYPAPTARNWIEEN